MAATATQLTVTAAQLNMTGVTAGTHAASKFLSADANGIIDKVISQELQLTDTDQSNTLALVWNEDETVADRTLNIKVNAGAVTLDMKSGTNQFASLGVLSKPIATISDAGTNSVSYRA